MEYLSLLQLLVLAATVFSVTSNCPSREDIYPCTCDDIREGMKLVCKDRKTTLTELKTVLSYFTKEEVIVMIVLEDLTLGTLPPNFFDGLAVRDLLIYHCEMDFEDGEPPFKGLENSLEGLLIYSSLTQKNYPLNLKFGHMENLQKLRLTYNTIKELGDDVFTNGNSKLLLLDISYNRIEKIGEKAFENLKNLKVFSLDGNQLGPLRRHMIPTSTDSLKTIGLSKNGLSYLPEDIFTYMPSLDTIYLQGNNITTLDRSTWESIVEQLFFTNLEGNPLQCDYDMEWLFEKRISPRRFFGTCAGPEGKEGMRFIRFLREGKGEQ